jgi:hypothetical protein
MKTLFLLKMLLLLCVLTTCCGQKPEPKMVRLKEATDKHEIVFFYHKQISYEARQDFENRTFWRQKEDGGYEASLGTFEHLGIKNSGYVGSAVGFREEATSEQIAEAVRLLKASPLVYRVYENIAPNDIHNLETSTKK